LPLICAGAAFADDASLDAAYAAAYAQDTGTNTIVTIMAGIVFVLLVLVTGGVSSSMRHQRAARGRLYIWGGGDGYTCSRYN
jgi:hypothetical protein